MAGFLVLGRVLITTPVFGPPPPGPSSPSEPNNGSVIDPFRFLLCLVRSCGWCHPVRKSWCRTRVSFHLSSESRRCLRGLPSAIQWTSLGQETRFGHRRIHPPPPTRGRRRGRSGHCRGSRAIQQRLNSGAVGPLSGYLSPPRYGTAGRPSQRRPPPIGRWRPRASRRGPSRVRRGAEAERGQGRRSLRPKPCGSPVAVRPAKRPLPRRRRRSCVGTGSGVWCPRGPEAPRPRRGSARR